MENNSSPASDGPTEKNYHQNKEIEGRPTLTNVDTDNVTVSDSEIDDDSTGMGTDDFLGKTNSEE